jgi:hypothetical protein
MLIEKLFLVIQTVFEGLFYSESRTRLSPQYLRRVKRLERRLEAMDRALIEHPSTAVAGDINAALDTYIKSKLPQLLERQFAELRSEDIVRLFRQETIAHVHRYLEDIPVDQLIAERAALARDKRREDSGVVLQLTIEQQMASVGRLKAVMINLFVLFNIGILLVYLFAASDLSDRAVYAISGLYVSLAAFIVYIYRSSNFRSSVLLALREDGKKAFDAMEYLERFTAKNKVTASDVEVLRMLLVNRAEREKQVDHPYELVLKGVSNTNVQLRGGKIVPK